MDGPHLLFLHINGGREAAFRATRSAFEYSDLILRLFRLLYYSGGWKTPRGSIRGGGEFTAGIKAFISAVCACKTLHVTHSGGLIKFSSEPNYAKFACFVTVRGLDPFRCIFHFFNLRLDAFTSWFANLAKNGVCSFSLFRFNLLN